VDETCISVQEVPELYVRVDAAKCCGYVLCVETCPEVFKLDDRGFAYVENNEVTGDLEEGARQAAEACPRRAIYVGETPPDEIADERATRTSMAEAGRSGPKPD
jgi:ferredoxin